ncbi:MAG TPA: hypothetical protein VE129_04815 [Thermoanaerobaculia bacterium]|nr:hypothetical protein [Thermoanaerobaculia bacterium]
MPTRSYHNRCDLCYLSTRGVRVPWSVKDPDDVVAEWLATGEPCAVFLDNNLGSDPEHL